MTVLTLLAGTLVAAAPARGAAPIASVRLFNPTRWSGPTVVEVPVGSLVTPGLVDWGRLRLIAAGHDVPFAIREGRRHAAAALVAPVRDPRAEDLLVFSCAVTPGRWLRLDLVPGSPPAGSALRRRDGALIVSYPGLVVTFDAESAMLRALRAHGVEMLREPMALVLWRAEPRGVRPSEFAAGLARPTYEIKRTRDLGAPRARLVASSSTPAMTELHFVLEHRHAPALALTYRVHRAGRVEVVADERPWTGASPWIGRAAHFRLDLAGEAEPLSRLANRAPYYGFKEYAAAVHFPAEIRRKNGAALVVLGEEFANGRRWSRNLLAAAPGDAANARELATLADEGLIVDPAPFAVPWLARAARLTGPPPARTAMRTLEKSLEQAGVSVSAGAPGGGQAIAMELVGDGQAVGISGDGFAVRPAPDGGVAVLAATPFGLMQAAHRLAERIALTRPGAPVRVPLIAANPVVDLRAGGFGGGDFEVDFPYGDDAEWESVLDRLVASGMNVMGDLGMWGNWKMPVSYRYMPELRSEAPDAYDEVSGARFADFASHREHGLKLLRFLHERGVRVWLWLPIGAVPTTYARAHPEAMSPRSERYPCFTHPLYGQYLRAFLRESLETYPIDGVVMIRDDNGGICDCDRCQTYLKASRTHSPVWEQYLILYDALRKQGFGGDVAVYPYFDHYEPSLEPLLPGDLRIVGHGAGLGVLTRAFESVAPMGDTWLDNLMASFRLAPTARMRRLLADRGSFWIGGAYRGTELPWEAIGRFGREPTATPNTARYEWGRRTFGEAGALPFVRMSAAYERLWDLFAVPLYPNEWTRLAREQRRATSIESREWLRRFRATLSRLRAVADGRESAWFAHVGLYGRFFERHLRFLERFDLMREVVEAARRSGGGLSPAERARLLALQRAMYVDAEVLDGVAAQVPGSMMARTRAGGFMRPYGEWSLGAYGMHEPRPGEAPQFGGTLEASAVALEAGEPFTLTVRMRNDGVCPWMPEPGYRLELAGDAARLGLPARRELTGRPVAYGETAVIELRGVAPSKPGEAEIVLTFRPPFHAPQPWLSSTTRLSWR
ncbi:MAG: hypothetical protein IT208_10935 [Chthonomonadales bacterium]|nr:hypothetical protein [Chthonomonadales bacterium]